MPEKQQGSSDFAQLPHESVHWLTRPLARFLRIEAVAAAVLLFFTIVAMGLAVVRLMTHVGIRSMSVYVLAGAFIWFTVDRSGIHATITGVVLGLMTPTGRWVSDERLYSILDRVVAHPAGNEGSGATQDRQSLRLAETAARETLAPAERIQIALHPWVAYLVMPLFALANAGVPLSLDDLDDSITVAVFVGFALGKPAGILAFTWLALRLGALKPPELDWRLLAGGSILAGIGFTMALFISNLAFDTSLLNQAKLGIFLASLFSAAAGLTLLFWVTRQKNHAP